MPARRCRIHGINFDLGVKRCPICDEPTFYVTTTNPDPDRAEQVTRLLPAPPATEDDAVTGWRLHRLLELGCDREDAEHLAGRRDFDIHEFAKLLRAGCPYETALRILG